MMPNVEEMLPTFATTGKTLRIPTKDTVVFPCEVNNLGKYVLAWKRGNAILTAGPTKVSPDDRIRLVEGYNLEIRDVQTTDAGDYICHIATLKPREITHTLEVLVPPRIQRSKTGSMVEVRKGTMVTLDCEASGNPVPTITWTRKNNLLPSGEKSFTGPSYTIDQTTRHHSGTYICTASNGVGNPAQEQTNLVVHYPPEIEVEKDWVHTGEGREAELVCIVHAEPPAEVHWYRNTLRLDITERRITENRGSRHTLIIRKVHSTDFGNYSCFADNPIGKNRQFVTLSGKPHPAIFRSNSNGKQKDSYNITWAVSSYTPIEEYKLSYRSVSEAPQTFQPHYISYPNKYDLKPGKKDGDVMYAPGDYEGSGARSKWKNFTIQTTPSDQFTHSMSFLITDLDPATQYEAKVIAKNRFGWSEPPREAFRFTTKGAETNPDSANDVYSEPEMRDMGVKKAMNEASQTFNSIYTKIFVAFVSMMLSNFYMSGL
ncbi:limbic system-associated membrane protein-like isoform X2 [Planococcus citri]